MKKLFLSILAVATLASCTKDESFYTEQDSEIKLAPVASMLTKAVPGAVDGTTYPADENFDVYAYWKNEGAGSSFTEDATKYLGDPAAGYGVEFVKKGDWFWGGTTPYYWPKNGSLRFAAYSPADLAHEVKHDLASDTYTVLGYTQPYNTANTFDFLLAPTSVSYTSTTAVDDVDIVFEHALSWITLQAKAKDAVAADAFTVHEITINNVNTVADLTAAMPEKTWSNWATPQSYVVNSNVDITIDETVQVLDKVANGTVVIPQATTTVTVKYTQNALEGTPALENQEITVPLLLDGNNTPWEPGKHYIYTLIFGLDEILITPAVADWEDVNVPAADVTATEVSNAEELISAVAAGRSVRLTNNIDIAEPVVLNGADKNVQVELNGYTLNASEAWIDASDNSTNSYAFWVKAGSLTINGPGKVETTASSYSIAVWADGGNVTINGGEYYNAGEGSDLIYAKNNGNVVINGGYFKACEKQAGTDGTNEKYSALNLHGSKPGTITVYGGTFYGFDPANNKSENPAQSFVAPGYNVISTGMEYTVYPANGVNVALTGETVVYGSLKITNGTLDGNNNLVTVPETLTDNGLIRPAGDVAIKNVKIDGANKSWDDKGTIRGLRAIFINAGGNYVLDNVDIKNVTYAINVNTTQPTTLKVTNSVLEGWTSYGGSTTGDFANVEFKVGPSQKTFRPYGNTVLTGCSFQDGFVIDLSELVGTIVFENCTYNGQPLTAANLTDAPAAGVTIR